MKCNTPVRAIYNYSLSTKSYCVCTKPSHWQISVYCSKWNGVRNYHRMATSGAIIIFLIRYQWSKHPQLKSSIHKMTDIIGIFSNYNYSIIKISHWQVQKEWLVKHSDKTCSRLIQPFYCCFTSLDMSTGKIILCCVSVNSWTSQNAQPPDYCKISLDIVGVFR